MTAPTDLQSLIDAGQPIPAGDYTLTAPLDIGNSTGGLACRSAAGAGSGYLDLIDATKTVLRVTTPGMPAIRFTGARRSSLAGVSLIGPYFNTLLWKPQGPDVTKWPEWNERYKPSAAIVVDGVSSVVNITNCDITGWGTGVVTYPDGGDGQGEFITLDNCGINFCTYGISISHTQNRKLVVRNCREFLGLHTAITNRVHGLQNGFVDGLIQGCGFNTVERLGYLNTCDSGCIVFQSCYGEQIGSLGQFDGFGCTYQSPVWFRDCTMLLYLNRQVSTLASGTGSFIINGGYYQGPDGKGIGAGMNGKFADTVFRPYPDPKGWPRH